jgi:beta-glucanase (GH16 family)
MPASNRSSHATRKVTAIEVMALTLARCAAVFFFAGCLQAGEPDSPFVPKGYARVFSAEFDDQGEVFNPHANAQFTTGHFRLSGEGDLNTVRRLGNNSELQLYLDEDFEFAGQKPGINPFSVKDGMLTITADRLSDAGAELLTPLAKEEIPPPSYSSGLLSTETAGRSGKGFAQQYGYWELRAKLPKGKGLWPAFWLVTETHDYWDEVDIFEVLGHQPDAIYHSTHFHDGGGTDNLSWEERTCRQIDTSDGFHIYGMEITKDELINTVDGRETLRVAHKLEKPLYTIINLAVGGKWPGNPDENTLFPAKMEIDYLRIYRQEPQ